MPDCGLTVFDGAGRLVRSLRVQTPDGLDAATLDLVHRQCIAGSSALYAELNHGPRTLALFLHHQVVPPASTVTAARRRSPGRWVTHTVPLGAGAGGRGVLGPEVFFRQADIDIDRAWLAALLLRLSNRHASHTITVGDEELWSWEHQGERYFYVEGGSSWSVYGAGNTPLLRLEQAVHLAAPQTAQEYLWAIGAIPLRAPRGLR